MIGSIAKYMNQTINANPPNETMSLHVWPSGQYFSLKSSNVLGKFVKVAVYSGLVFLGYKVYKRY